MRGGFVIGVPLTLLQLGVGVHDLHLVDVANNFALCHAIYDADRLTSPPWARDRFTTRVAAAASAAYYAASETGWIAPLVVALHAGYTPLKPAIAPVKPFFVAAMWTLGIYYAPLARQHADMDVLTPAALFLAITGLSHAVDVVDLEDDRRDGIRTPAVLMGREQAKQYVLAITFAAVFVHSWSPMPFLPYDVLFLASTYGVLYESSTVATAIVLGFAFAYASTHDVELMGSWLRSTEGSHKMAIEFAVEAVRHAAMLPDPYKHVVLDACFRLLEHGDEFGSYMLDVYESAVRDRLLLPPR